MDADQFQQFMAAARQGSETKLRTFSSGDAVGWLSWRQHAESVGTMKNWERDPATRTTARWAIRAAMEDAAARAVSDIDAAGIPAGGDTVASFLDLYQQRFCPEAESRIARAAFKSASQAGDRVETVLEWHTRCRSLYLRAYPTQAGNVEQNQELIDRFVEGLHEPVVRTHTYDAYPNTYAVALTSASNKTASVAVMAGLEGRKTKDPFLPKAEGDLLAMGPSPKDDRCFFCEKTGHYKADCRMWKKAMALMKNQGNQRNGGNPGNQNPGNRGPGNRNQGNQNQGSQNQGNQNQWNRNRNQGGRRGNGNGRTLNQMGEAEDTHEADHEDQSENC